MKKLIVLTVWLVATPSTIISSLFLSNQIIKTKKLTAGVKSVTVYLINQENSYKMFAALPNQLSTINSAIISEDARPLIVENILKLHKSPLADYAQLFVEVSDKYGLDFRLLPAIALKESGGGRVVPYNSFNPFGWAIHENYTKKFSSWEEAIETVARGLKEEYIDKGLTTPEEIMTKYTPASIGKGGSWAKDINYYFELME